jgi:hypothetical protein
MLRIRIPKLLPKYTQHTVCGIYHGNYMDTTKNRNECIEMKSSIRQIYGDNINLSKRLPIYGYSDLVSFPEGSKVYYKDQEIRKVTDIPFAHIDELDNRFVKFPENTDLNSEITYKKTTFELNKQLCNVNYAVEHGDQLLCWGNITDLDMSTSPSIPVSDSTS